MLEKGLHTYNRRKYNNEISVRLLLKYEKCLENFLFSSLTLKLRKFISAYEKYSLIIYFVGEKLMSWFPL